MNIENLRINYSKLLTQMKETGYSDDYVHRFRREIEWILSEAGQRDWRCYHDIYQHYESVLQTQKALEKKHAILATIVLIEARLKNG